jgi:hypothetical protein
MITYASLSKSFVRVWPALASNLRISFVSFRMYYPFVYGLFGMPFRVRSDLPYGVGK